LLKKSQINEPEFNILLEIILRKVVVIKTNDLKKHYKEAYALAKDIDLNDLLFFACALEFSGSFI